ncbi:MAG: hypothetical protein IJU02_07110 [Lachnospiraceae bacterium]|nr:hypothetical protein [Lachnospiraceae bacterium]
MNLFTVNQVNQVYVADDFVTGVSNVSSLGKISLETTDDGKFYFVHYGKAGKTRSDLIDPKTVSYVNATPAGKMTKKLKSVYITLNSTAKNSTNVGIAGEDFILRLAFTNYIGISPEDTQYLKYGVVHSTSGMTAVEFYLKLAKSIATNMSREALNFIKVYVTDDVDDTTDYIEVTAESNVDMGAIGNNGNSPYYVASGGTGSNGHVRTFTGVVIQIQEPDWILGLKQQKAMDFEVSASPVENSNGEDVFWADITYSDGVKITGGADTPTKSIETTSGNIPVGISITNGKLAAEYEYFFHGERGDQYRLVNWPDYIPTEYMVNPSYVYDFITVHFAYEGPNEDIQKSGKDITILMKSSESSPYTSLDSESSALLDAINAIVSPNYTVTSGTTTTGNVPKFDSNGNLVDSGKAASSIT